MQLNLEKIAGQELDLFCAGLEITLEEFGRMAMDRIEKLLTSHHRENTEWYGPESSGAKWAAEALEYVAALDAESVPSTEEKTENEPMPEPPAEIVIVTPDAE